MQVVSGSIASNAHATLPASKRSGPTPGPQLGNASLVDVVVAVDTPSSLVRVLVWHFSGNLAATTGANATVEVCGLPASTTATAVLWMVDDTHATYWTAWRKDVSVHAIRSFPFALFYASLECAFGCRSPVQLTPLPFAGVV